MIKNHDSISPSSFADNLEFTTPDISEFIPAFQTITKFASNLKLTLDVNKSWCWANTQAARKALKLNLFANQILCPVVYQAKDLGQHLSYCKNVYNKTFSERLYEGHRRLDVMLARNFPWHVVIRMLRTNVFPATFWGAEGTFISDQRMTTFRAKLVKVLRLNKSQRSTDLALATAGYHTDPIVCVLWKRLSFFHRFCRRYPTYELDSFFTQGSSSYKQGICNLLRSSLKHIQAELNPNRTLSTPDEIIHLDNCSNNQLWQFVSRAWNTRLTHSIKKRKGMFASPAIDWNLTLACLSKLNYVDAALVRIHLSFGYHTGEQNKRWS